MDIKIGLIVKSAAGHDKDSFMVITAVEDDFAFLADGKHRKLSSPKKKRIKHLKLTNTAVNADNLTDKALRSLLREYREKSCGNPLGNDKEYNLNQNV